MEWKTSAQHWFLWPIVWAEQTLHQTADAYFKLVCTLLVPVHCTRTSILQMLHQTADVYFKLVCTGKSILQHTALAGRLIHILYSSVQGQTGCSRLQTADAYFKQAYYRGCKGCTDAYLKLECTLYRDCRRCTDRTILYWNVRIGTRGLQ